ncbi:MAG: hypothetical protein HQM03_15135 [Magnetococcales bacterium]|nr:hypothetical protein [Magnetococcales bacterium]
MQPPFTVFLTKSKKSRSPGMETRTLENGQQVRLISEEVYQASMDAANRVIREHAKQLEEIKLQIFGNHAKHI